MQVSRKKYDVVVIGGGIAGIYTAISVAENGFSVLIVEENPLSEGNFLNKEYDFQYLYDLTLTLSDVQNKKRDGIQLKEMSLRFDKLAENKKAKKEALIAAIRDRLASLGVEVLQGFAQMLDNSRIDVHHQGRSTGLYANNVVIATGCKSVLKEQFAAVPGLTTLEELFSMMKIPGELLLIGGGIKAYEIAGVYSFFGSRVTIVQPNKTEMVLLEDGQLQQIEDRLRLQGVSHYPYSKIQDIYRDSSGNYHLEIWQEGEIDSKHLRTEVLTALPEDSSRLEGLLGIQPDMTGQHLFVNNRMQTSVENVYAIGSVIGKGENLEMMAEMAQVIAENISGNPKEIDYQNQVFSTKTLPQTALVGLTETQARNFCEDVVIEKYPTEKVGEDLQVQLVSDKKYGEILGVSASGKGAEAIIKIAKAYKELEYTRRELLPHLLGVLFA
ncbi:MAG: NAD(P)/FAD-dependent oxidoreductase [Eubacteriaceae bacterium]|jgi:dihydrolipoamide dehydrogenase|nr:NAD(P)/FAD-dependent oxidoreductase [Eubacteriaceae bacterium]